MNDFKSISSAKAAVTAGVTIRPATFTDARGIYTLIASDCERLITRSLTNVIENIDRFMVAVSDRGEIVGTIAYQLWAEFGNPLKTTAELQSVCVKPDWRKCGVDRAMVDAQLKRLEGLRVWQIIVLTFETQFFRHMGFEKVDKHLIMHKLYRGCANCSKHESPFTCPEVAMARPGWDDADSAKIR
ncbi:MAG: GNAT family N-acetyltransferase [Kiritimatiellia bacterium]